jgi:fluoride exporter
VTLPVLVALGLAGGAGAIARFVVDGTIATRAVRTFPLGTLAVNVTGAFGLGVLVGAAAHGDVLRIAGTGFLGAYTTFSTWAFETQRLGEDGQVGLGALNLLGSLAAGLAVAWLGRKLGAAL